MATLTILNLDPTTVERLKTQAKAHNRSLEAEVRTILETVVRPADREAFLREAARIRAMTPAIHQTDSTELIREDRDSDYGRDP
ncbi:MAG TPA: plasmid stabilization protein [Kiloniellales bacterium]|nr:plasmid stabilization protein [Kiloniellales bacterium]